MDSLRHKSNLKKMLLGVLLLLAVVLFNWSRLFPSVESKLAVTVKQLNTGLPRMIDSNIRFDHASSQPPTGIEYEFTLVNLPKNLPTDWRANFEQDIRQRLVANAEFHNAIQAGITAIFVFHNETGQTVAQITIKPDNAK